MSAGREQDEKRDHIVPPHEIRRRRKMRKKARARDVEFRKRLAREEDQRRQFYPHPPTRSMKGK